MAKATSPKKRHAAELIAFHLGYDMAEMSEYRYQSTKYSAPAVYAIGDYYYACPANSQQRMPMHPTIWDFVGSYYGRSIFRVHMNDRCD